MAKKIRILSIDGGGIRGIVPGLILARLERILQEKTDNSTARLADFFDFYAGTSTGGILASAIFCPHSADPDKPRYTAKEAVGIYLERGGDIFDANRWEWVKKMKNVFLDEKYDAGDLEKALDEYFGDTKLSEALKPGIITSYDIGHAKTRFFTRTDARADANKNMLLKDICRGTSAAPTYFEAANLKSIGGRKYLLIDGGVFANNPSMCAYAEVRSMEEFGHPTAKDMLMFSIGCGSDKAETYNYDDVKGWGLLGWAKPSIKIMMNASAETVAYQLEQMFDTVVEEGETLSDYYLRIDPSLYNAKPSLDCATEKNLDDLKEAGHENADQYESELKALADKLIAYAE